MKIKPILNKKPEYKTQEEEHNKFLQIIFSHKKITISLVLIFLLIIFGYMQYLYYSASVYNVGGAVSIETPTDKLNSKIELFDGIISGAELKVLIREINTHNTNNTFPNPIHIEYTNIPNSELKSKNNIYSSS